MTDESERRKYWAGRRRMNILGATIFVGFAGIFVLVATQMLEAAWSAWWVIPGGFSLGFAVALAGSMVMEYYLGREYERIDLPFWKYILVRFRFLFVLFIAPTALVLLMGLIYFSVAPVEEGGSLYRWILPRALAFVVVTLFAGYALPYLFRRAAGAKETQSQRLRSIANEVAEEIGMSVQGVYEAPLDGLRGANAAQVGFVRGRRSVFVLGEWEEHFTDDEMKAVLAHEFAHAKRNHVGKGIALTAFCRVGVPGLLFLFTWLAIELFDIPEPVSGWGIAALVGAVTAIVLGAHLFPRWVAREFELEADSKAASVSGSAATISALEKLAELNLVPKERQHLLSTHPSVQDRIRALKT